jgi:hypothetical protein
MQLRRVLRCPQEMENEQDQADDQQDVHEAGANVKCEKAKQPQNHQNQGDKSDGSFVSSSGARNSGSLAARRAVMAAVRKS